MQASNRSWNMRAKRREPPINSFLHAEEAGDVPRRKETMQKPFSSTLLPTSRSCSTSWSPRSRTRRNTACPRFVGRKTESPSRKGKTAWAALGGPSLKTNDPMQPPGTRQPTLICPDQNGRGSGRYQWFNAGAAFRIVELIPASRAKSARRVRGEVFARDLWLVQIIRSSDWGQGNSIPVSWSNRLPALHRTGAIEGRHQ